MSDALIVADYILHRCNELNAIISNLKLQKILYFVQAEFLVATGKSCFAEPIEAWDFGPVIPVVYRKYKIYGGGHIPIISSKRFDNVLSEADKKLIDGIVDECLPYSAAALTEITQKQTPWKGAYTPSFRKVITTASIRAFFS